MQVRCRPLRSAQLYGLHPVGTSQSDLQNGVIYGTIGDLP